MVNFSYFPLPPFRVVLVKQAHPKSCIVSQSEPEIQLLEKTWILSVHDKFIHLLDNTWCEI